MKMLRDALDRLAGKGLDLRPAARRVRGWVAPAGPVAGLVSIILPTRDRAGTLPRAINSVLMQSYANWELIIIDDGSTDDTASVMKGYRTERRIQYLRRAARGATAARNAGLRTARGDMVAYIDSDNDWDGAFLDFMVPAFADAGIDCAYGKLLLHEGTENPRVLFEPFDRAALLKANSIDINVFMHRVALFKSLGGFDEELKRLGDWDLILRYTEHSPAVQVEAAMVNYRFDGGNRITEREMFSPAYRRIRAKWRRYTPTPRAMKVLYVLVTETGPARTEISAMRRLGVEIATASESGVVETVTVFQPDILHVDRVTDEIAALGLPVTIRDDAPMFDIELFKPGVEKNRRMVMQACGARTAEELRFFAELAARLSEFRFVLCIDGAAPDDLPDGVEILRDVPAQHIAALLGEAGIYLHFRESDQTPAAIAEAMASGCYMLVKNLPPLVDYIGDAGDAYEDINEAEAAIRATLGWNDGAWAAAARRSTERAWSSFTGEDDFHALYEEWAAIVNA